MKCTTILLIIACLCLVAGSAAADEKFCMHYYNLQEENRMQIAAPTIVDINEYTGNLLVRGPMPLIIRDGTSNTAGCKPPAQWQFAYDNLNAMLNHDKDHVPAYFTDSKRTALAHQMENFDLKDYTLIDISLHTVSENYFLNKELDAYGRSFTVCSAPIKDAKVSGHDGSIVNSMTTQCDPNDSGCLRDLIFTDNRQANAHCSLKNLTTQLFTLMQEKDPQGRKRLIYYHDGPGNNQAGVVTMTYLLTSDTDMSIVDAQDYAQYLGDHEADTARVPAGGWTMAEPFTALARYYCNNAEPTYNSPRCNVKEPPRVYLPGTDTHSHLPGQDPALNPTPAPTPVPVAEPTPAPLPVQTPVPAGPYHPDTSGATF